MVQSCFHKLLYLLVFLSASSGLFAAGKKEEPADPVPVNAEWVLCVTSPDVSALDLAWQITGTTVTKSLAASLSSLDFRLRGEDESAYYRDYAWAKSRSEAAKALAAKRNERDLLIYRGDPSWKYRKNLKALDSAIATLEENLAKIDALAPAVEGKPVFRLCAANLGGSYPEAPEPGNEYRFCTEQKADAFLTGTLSEYHGRIYLSIRMYTLFSRSYTFGDEILFSSEDLTDAMDEISLRLAAAVSETLPSAILVHASPENAMVLVDSALVGLGETELRTYPPGNVDLAVRADNYVPSSFPLELKPGELAELYINLTPLGAMAFSIDVPGRGEAGTQEGGGAKVYLGGLYVGEAPLTLELPRSQYAYISVETSSGETGSAVYRDNNLVRGSAKFVRNDDVSGTAVFGTKAPVSPEEKRVDRARRGFYGMYGAFWFILPAGLLTAGIAGTHAYRDSEKKIVFENDYWAAAYYGGHVMWGTALGVTLFQMFRYLYFSGGDATPIVKSNTGAAQ